MRHVFIVSNYFNKTHSAAQDCAGTSRQPDISMPIHVTVRARPLFSAEKRSCELVNEGRQIGLVYNGTKLLFGIPQLFSEETTNGEVADSILPPVIDKAISGCISAVVAYGQTNSGKTYTILGDERLFVSDNRRKRGFSAKKGSFTESEDDWDSHIPQTNREGLIIQGLRRIYNLGFMVKLNFLEVYCEKLYDLQTNNTPYSVMIDHSNNPDRSFYHTSSFSSLLAQLNTTSMPQLQQTTGTFKNLTETVCETLQQALTCLKNACRQRMTASTIRNDVSSRSHFLAIITILGKPLSPGGEYRPLGKIYFCDLAGSERFNAFGAIGSSATHSPGHKAREERRLAEGIDINKSLLTLRKVLEDLASHKSHVPYRASMLTKILRTPFENGYVTFLATVNAANTTETKRTLDYACITRRITFTKAPSAISKAHPSMSCVCQDCLKRMLRGSFGVGGHPSVLFCKFCGNELGALSETDESFCHKGESESTSESTYIPDRVESLRVKGTPRYTLKGPSKYPHDEHDPVVTSAIHNIDKNVFTSNCFLDQKASKSSTMGGRVTSSSSDKFEPAWTSNRTENNTSTSTQARPISAIDIVAQEIKPVDPSAQLISVASLLYGLESQSEDPVRRSSAVEDRGVKVAEVSMQTDSQKNDVSDEQFEKEERDDSPSIWSVYESSLRKTQIHLPHGVTKGMQLHMSSPTISTREHAKPLAQEASYSVLDMLEESNLFLRKSSLNLSTMDKANKKTNTTYLIAVVCNEILETKGFEIDTLSHSTLCLDAFYTILARIICSGNAKYKKIQVENSADYRVFVYKLKKDSTLTPYNYEQLRMDAFSEAYCQVDTFFEMFMSTAKRAEQAGIAEETIREVVWMASEALISNLARIVSSAVYECFAALLEEIDGQLSLSTLSQRSKMSSDLQEEFKGTNADSTSTTNIVSSFLSQLK